MENINYFKFGFTTQDIMILNRIKAIKRGV